MTTQTSHPQKNLRYEQTITAITSFLEKNICGILFLLILINFADVLFFSIPYSDSDSYMRLIRLHNWIQTPSFWEQPIWQSNYPFGEISHWTRPMDILWLLCSLPFFCFMDIKSALFTGGHLLSPLCFLLSLWVLAYGLKRYFNIWIVLCGCLFFLANIEFQAYYSPDYADHHSLMMLLALSAATLELCWYKDQKHKYLTGLGIILALSCMVAIEGIILFAVFLFPFILQYLHTDSTLKPICCISRYFAVFLTLFWLLNPPYEGWFYPDNGRISVLFIVCFWLFYLNICLVNKYSPPKMILKISYFALAGIITLLFLLFIFGKDILIPPLNNELNHIWANRLIEMQSFTDFTLPKQIKYYAFSSVALLLNLIMLRNKSYRSLLLLNLCWGVPLYILSLFWGRFTAYQVVFTAIPFLTLIAVLYQNATSAAKNNAYFPLSVWLTLLAVFLLEQLVDLPNTLSAKQAPNLVKPSAPDICRNIKNTGGTLVTDVFFAPQYMWECDINTVGTPYHRNRQGLLDNHNILNATKNEELLSLLKKHLVTQILLFSDYDNEYYSLAPQNQNKLYYRLLKRTNIPPYLEEIPSSSPQARHYRINYDVDFPAQPLENKR